MGLLDRLFGGSPEPSPQTRGKRRELEGWKTISQSKYPERQVVLDYMGQYGIELVESPSGIFHINNLNCPDFDGFQRMTNYRAKIGGVGHVAVQYDDGNTQNHFMTFEDAFTGLAVLYNVIRTTPGEDDY